MVIHPSRSDGGAVSAGGPVGHISQNKSSVYGRESFKIGNINRFNYAL
jgi:hypothetical protein